MKSKNVLIYILMILFSMTSVYGEIYNTTNLTGATDFYEKGVALQEITGLIGVTIILIMFVVTFIITYKNTNDVFAAMPSAGWFSALVATILVPIDLLKFETYQFTLLICGIFIVLGLVISKKR